MNFTMKAFAEHPRTCAAIGALLAIPIPIVLVIAVYEIEPAHGFLRAILAEPASVGQKAVALATLITGILLLPFASVITLAPVVRNVRSGFGFGINRLNLALGVSILLFFGWIAGVFVIDQFPCWMGVPNCD